MKIQLAYGKKGLPIEISDNNLVKVMSMKAVQPLPDTYIQFTKSFLRPIGVHRSLFDMAKRKKSACIVICDITRPVPNRQLLPPILKVLHAAGLTHLDISILIATGVHRPNLGAELVELVGSELARDYRIFNHNARDRKSHRHLGATKRGTPVWLDKRYLDAEFKVITGFIEPHLMAGFSGGRKLIVPGIAGIDTMKVMHGAEMLSHPNAREGVIEGNPFHEEALEIARLAGVDFIVNVALDEKRNIIGIFSGDLEKAHREGIEFVRNTVTDTVPEPVDIVITTCGGYPLDATWYQSIKGLTAAMPVVKEGGTIIIVSECCEGVGGAEFTELACEMDDLEVFTKKIFSQDYFVIDQWQLQEYAKVAQKAHITLVSGGLGREQKDQLHLDWTDTVDEAVEQALLRHGEQARIAVIPKGPYILAKVG